MPVKKPENHRFFAVSSLGRGPPPTVSEPWAASPRRSVRRRNASNSVMSIVARRAAAASFKEAGQTIESQPASVLAECLVLYFRERHQSSEHQVAVVFRERLGRLVRELCQSIELPTAIMPGQGLSSRVRKRGQSVELRPKLLTGDGDSSWQPQTSTHVAMEIQRRTQTPRARRHSFPAPIGTAASSQLPGGAPSLPCRSASNANVGSGLVTEPHDGGRHGGGHRLGVVRLEEPCPSLSTYWAAQDSNL